MYRVYSDSGFFEKTTTNTRTFKGRPRFFKVYHVPKRAYEAVPSYPGQYKTQEKSTYRSEMIKKDSQQRYRRAKKIKRMLDSMRNF
jgi:hypothetical protein